MMERKITAVVVNTMNSRTGPWENAEILWPRLYKNLKSYYYGATSLIFTVRTVRDIFQYIS